VWHVDGHADILAGRPAVRRVQPQQQAGAAVPAVPGLPGVDAGADVHQVQAHLQPGQPFVAVILQRMDPATQHPGAVAVADRGEHVRPDAHHDRLAVVGGQRDRTRV
jgi:hypothetical protein